MARLEDEQLITALQERFEANRRAISDLRQVTVKLETINRKLRESEALKSHFLSNIRNEVNNPLTAIMGLAHQLMSGNADAGQAVAAGNRIYAEAYTLNFQLENVFAAAELEAGRATPAPATADVATLIDELLERMGHRLAEKRQTVVRNGPASLPFVTDPRMLQLMVGNLLANAAEFGPEGETVTIDLDREDLTLHVSVGDHGPGIDPTHHGRIFDRFCQLDSGPAKQHRGHGLGLSVTRALAELQGGFVGVASAPGAGAVFTIILPEVAADGDTLALEGNSFLFGPPRG